jgi:hypothetical protein
MTTPEAIQEQIEKLEEDQEYGVFKLYKAISKHVSYAGRKNAEFIAIDICKGDSGAEAIVEYAGEPLSKEEVQELLTWTPPVTDPLANADEYHITTTNTDCTVYGNRIGDETTLTERPPRPWESKTRWEMRGISVADDFLSHITKSRLRVKTLLNYGDEPDQVTLHVDE